MCIRDSGAPGIEHIIDQNQVTTFDSEGDDRRLDLRMQALRGEIIAVEGDVDQPDILGKTEEFL